MILEVASTSADWRARMLSNFAPHAFVLDGVRCGSMEGWLQSLKAGCREQRNATALLAGAAAKRAGRMLPWPSAPHPRWGGVVMERTGAEYRLLLTRAYGALWEQAPMFRRALQAIEPGTQLGHAIGRTDPMQTILTRAEFVGQLEWLRAGTHEAGE